MNLRILLLLCVVLFSFASIKSVDATLHTETRTLQSSTSCPTGKYPSGSSCYSCKTGCASCSSYSNCFGCKSGYYSSGSSCYRCSTKCSSCKQGSSYCTSCASGYYRTTTSSYYPSGTFNCGSCSTGCSSCTSSTYCSTCKSGYKRNSSAKCEYVGTIYTNRTASLSSGGAAGIGVGAGVVCIIIVVIAICMIRKKNLRRAQQTTTTRSAGGQMTMGTAQPITPSPAPGYMAKPVTQPGITPTPGSSINTASPSTNGGYTPQPAPYMPPAHQAQFNHQPQFNHQQPQYGYQGTQPQGQHLPPGFAGHGQGSPNQLPPGFMTAQGGNHGRAPM